MQMLLPMLNRAAEAWFALVFHVSWQASLLAALILVAVLLGRRWPSPLRYWLLVLALAKFALPPMVALPTGLFGHVGPAVKVSPTEAILPAAALAETAVMGGPTSLGSVPATPFPIDLSPERTRPATKLSPPAPALDGKAWLMLLHVFGVLVAALLIVRSLLAMRRTLRLGTEVPDGDLRRQFVRLSEQIGLRRPPRLLLTDEPCGPAAFGVLRPVVILPDAVASLPASELDVILAHELAHHRRRDLWINWVQLALTAVWWFNPVLWILNRQIRKVREDCCDDLLLTRNLTTRHAYCDTLLRAASLLAGRTTAKVSLGFGDRLHPLGRRFERIMDQTLRRAPRLSLAGFVFLAVLAGLVLPGLRRSDGDEPSPTTAGEQEKPAATKATADAKVAIPATALSWPEGITVKGRVVDHKGEPVVNAEILMLGKERIQVEPERRTWFVLDGENSKPASARTDKNGAFTITREKGTADRLAVIAENPLLWVVSRGELPPDGDVEIKLPQAGSLAIHCDIPSNQDKQSVVIELRSFDGIAWESDCLRFHPSGSPIVNPGESVFERLPPGQYAVQRHIHTKTGSNSFLLSGADRVLVKIEAAKRAGVRFERKIGQPLSGRVRGLENVELRQAILSITHDGPEEIWKDGTKNRMLFIAFDVIPITSEGRFTTDPIPPGKYSASLYAVRASPPGLSAQSPDFSGELKFTVPEQGEMPKIEIVAKANAPVDLSKVKDARIRVIDEAGKPVPKPKAMIHSADNGYSAWIDGNDGMVFFGDHWLGIRSGDAFQILVRADDYAPTIVRFAGDQREKLRNGEATVTLQRGRKVELRFNLPEGMTWPKGTLPEAYFDDLQGRVRAMRQPSNRRGDENLGVRSDFNMLNLREIGAGRFEFQLAEDTPRFHVAIHAPGFLQFYETGPFTLADVKNGILAINVPRPATFDVSFEPGADPGTDVPFTSASLDVMWQLQGNSFLTVTSTSSPSLTPKLKVTDLAPGQYLVSVRTQPKEDGKSLPRATINVGAYFDQSKWTLKAGQSERIDFRSTPFDPNAFRGKRTAVVRIRTPDGQPAKDRKASVTYFDGHYGAQVVFSGIVPASGEIVLADITDKAPSTWYPYRAYSVSIDDRPLGFFGFTKETLTQEFEFTLPPGVGDMAPDVELTRLAAGTTIRLSSLRGKIVFLEFWATWCGPCQMPMMKLNALADEQSAAWKDRVAFVPVSIDAEQTRVKSHVQQRGWNGLDHFWTGGSTGADFDAPAARAFVVFGVPEAVLIGRDGRILWRGHPGAGNSLDNSSGEALKARIEDALK